jgi:hypothetical protein
MISMLSAALVPVVDVLLLVLLSLVGAMIVHVIKSNAEPLETIGLAYPLGAGVVTWLVFGASLIGFRLTLLAVSVILAGSLAALVGVRATQAGPATRRDQAEQSGELSLWSDGLYGRGTVMVVLVATLLVGCWLSVGRSYSTYDATAGWAIKGYGIALEGDVRAGSTWGMWGLAYPLNIPLQVALFQLLDGDVLPGSKMIFPVYFCSLLLGGYTFWRKNRVSRPASLAGLLFMAANPLLFLHSTLGFANMPFATYIALGAIHGVAALDSNRSGEAMTSGLLFGLAGWTRPEGIGYALACGAVLFLASHVIHKHARGWISWIIPVVLLAIPWFALSMSSLQTSQLGVAMGGVMPSLRDGDYNLNYLAMEFRLFLDRASSPDNWGFLIPMLLFSYLFGLARFKRLRDVRAIAFAGVAGVVALIPFALFYVRSFTRAADFEDLLIRSFDRAFIPGAVLLILLAVMVSGKEL